MDDDLSIEELARKAYERLSRDSKAMPATVPKPPSPARIAAAVKCMESVRGGGGTEEQAQSAYAKYLTDPKFRERMWITTTIAEATGALVNRHRADIDGELKQLRSEIAALQAELEKLRRPRVAA